MDDDVNRELIHLRMGRITSCGSFTLTTSATSTTVSPRAGIVSARSVILTQAADANAINGEIIRIIPAKDSFVVTHTDPGGTTKTHRYTVLTGVRDTAFDP